MEISELVEKLKISFPQYAFVEGRQAAWSPKTRQVFYSADAGDQISIWSLLHELGHAVLGHRSYDTDIDLLQKEVAAWSQANDIAKSFDVSISESYAQNCLETYRNWLYKRSTCPECGTHGAQNGGRQYYCLNCKTHWNVSTSRFCRPYRGKAEKKSLESSSKLFVPTTF